MFMFVIIFTNPHMCMNFVQIYPFWYNEFTHMTWALPAHGNDVVRYLTAP